MKRRCIISSELIEMCSLIAIELEFSVNESEKIIKRLCAEPSLSHLKFLGDFDFEKINIKTELDDSDNERINLFFKTMGKTDAASMLELLEMFKMNMISSRKHYEEYYKNHCRLYIAFGILGGLAVTLVLI